MKVRCRSLSFIHILYKQALVVSYGGLTLSDTYYPAMQIYNVLLPGGSTGIVL